MKRLVRYFGVGAVAATVDISLFAIFAGYLGYPYLIVAAFTFILATFVNYVLSIRFVFESGVRFARNHEMAIVFLVSGVGLGLNQLVLYLGVGLAHIEPIMSKMIATATVFGWNYMARARFVFRRST